MPFVKRKRTYYKYGTELDASIVGSFARIDDGVVSGFSSTNYLEVTNSFDVSGGKTWEMVYKVTTGSDVTSYQSICGHESTSSNHDPVSIAVTTSSKFALTVCNSSSSGLTEDLAGSHTVTANTTYFVKLFFDGSKYVLSYSLDGVDYTEDVSYTSSTSIWTSNLILGRQESSASSMYPWLGSIDLTKSYININGERWWSGDSYTKVGSWIDDGIVSGFTAGNYLTTPETFNPQNNSWEMVYKIITGDDVITEGVITGEAVSVDYQNILSIVDARISFRWSSSHSSYDYTIEGSSTILANTTYWVKLKFDGVSTYTIELSTNGVDFTVDGSRTVTGYTFNSYSWNIGRSGHSTTTYALPFTNGSIDLSESYIKINNKDWWHGTKAVESTKEDADYHVDRNKLYQLAAVKRSYWKYQDWEQPVLTENGTMGGDSFAVEASSEVNSNRPAWQAFNGDTTSSYWGSVNSTAIQWLSFYNPKPLKVTALEIYSYYDASDSTYKSFYIKEAIIQGSNDNTNWDNIKTITNSAWVEKIPVDLSDNNKVYRYYRIYITDRAYYSGTYCSIDINEVKITAQEPIESTSSDYDYYTDKLVSYEPCAPRFERVTKTFTASDEFQTFVVPDGIASVKVTAVAGAGYSHTGAAGAGGRVICDLAVTGGQTLYIKAGSQPKSNSVTYNASDVRTDNTGVTDETSLQSRIIVAGGGGGQGSNSWAYSSNGGAGGGLEGVQGGNTYQYGYGGTGGTQTAGGSGGSGRSYTGSAGTFGLGGTGGGNTAGAGGAGWYGGGGGGYSGYDSKHWVAGGGGGSSYTDPDLCTNVIHTQGNNSGDGYVTISYTKWLRGGY